MIKAFQLNGKGERTQEAYARALRMLVEFYGKSPDLISEEELQDYPSNAKTLITGRPIPFLVQPVAVPSDSVPYCCLAKFLCIRDRRDSVPKKKICSSCYLRSPAQVASLRCAPLPKVSTPRPQLRISRPDKSLRLIITGALNPILRHPVSASHASDFPPP